MPQSYPSPHTPHTPHTLHTPHTPHTSHDCHVSNASVPTAQPSTLPASTLSRQNIWQGFKQLTPISLFVVVFGAAFGLAAIQVGLSNSATLSMSAFVFAGASQFATLELWGRASAHFHRSHHRFRHQRPPPSHGRHTLPLAASITPMAALWHHAGGIRRQLGNGNADLSRTPQQQAWQQT